MVDETDLQKLDGKVALFTLHSYMNANCDEVCDYINKTMGELEKDGYVKYLFDLQHLTLVNSRFIGLLGKRHYGLKERGGGIAILNAQDMVNKAFDMCGISDMLQFFFDREEAISSFDD